MKLKTYGYKTVKLNICGADCEFEVCGEYEEGGFFVGVNEVSYIINADDVRKMHTINCYSVTVIPSILAEIIKQVREQL